MSARHEGRVAYVDGVPLKSCPFRRKDDAKRWRAGWLDGLKADPLLDQEEKEAIQNEQT